MEDEVLDSFSKFKLVGEEAKGVELDRKDVRKWEEECARSLLGKIWGVKLANFTGLQNTLRLLWRQEGEMKLVELGNNFFQFIFANKEDADRVMQKRPWFFDNQMIVLQLWRPDLQKEDLSFRKGLLWVQIRGLPHHWSTKEVGWKLGKIFPSCLNVVIPEHGSKEGKLLRLLVEFHLDKPLLRGTKIKLDHELVWVDFRYEHLPTFCFYCGKVGHPEKICEQKLRDSQGNCICEDQYGEWLRAIVSNGGRRGEPHKGVQNQDFGKAPTQGEGAELSHRMLVTAQVGQLQSKAAQLQTTALLQNGLAKDTHAEGQEKGLKGEGATRDTGVKEQNMVEVECTPSFLNQHEGECGNPIATGAGEDHMENSRNEGAMEIEASSSLANLVRPPLKDLNPCVFLGGSRQPKDIKQASRSSWKRIAKGERQEGPQGHEQDKENSPASGLKRMRAQGDSEADLLLETEMGVKNKCLKVLSTTNSPMVEVASQNWPQLDK